MASSTLNFQVQHQVAIDVKVVCSRPNDNREIYLRYSPVLNAPIGVPVQLLQSC